MEREWQLQEAKNKLSEVVQLAHGKNAQVITVRGKPTAVVIAYDTYRQLSRPEQSLAEFFQQSPLADVELDLSRSKDTGRDVDL
jgi:prevent-host-death family protein